MSDTNLALIFAFIGYMVIAAVAFAQPEVVGGNVDPADLPAGRVQVRIGERVRSAELVTAFDEVPPGGLGLLVDSAGLVSLVVARSSESGVTTPVELGRSRAG